MADTTDGWLSAHLFYQGDLDLLLMHVVAPLADELVADEAADACFFLRYWDGGPHVRFRVHLSAPSRGQEIRSRITEECTKFFAAHPSADLVRAADYAQTAKVLAAGEGMASYATTMYPNNSVAFIPYRREHNVYGYGDSMRAVERHFSDSSRIALVVLTDGLSPERRAAASFSILVLTWLCGGMDHGLQWLEDHLDAAALDVPDASPAVYEERYLAQRDHLTGTTRRLRAMVRGPSVPASGTAVQWWSSVARLRDALPDEAGARIPTVLDMCAHLACNRLGTGITEERYLRYLAARAVSEVDEDRKGTHELE